MDRCKHYSRNINSPNSIFNKEIWEQISNGRNFVLQWKSSLFSFQGCIRSRWHFITLLSHKLPCRENDFVNGVNESAAEKFLTVKISTGSEYIVRGDLWVLRQMGITCSNQIHRILIYKCRLCVQRDRETWKTGRDSRLLDHLGPPHLRSYYRPMYKLVCFGSRPLNSLERIQWNWNQWLNLRSIMIHCIKTLSTRDMACINWCWYLCTFCSNSIPITIPGYLRLVHIYK